MRRVSTAAILLPILLAGSSSVGAQCPPTTPAPTIAQYVALPGVNLQVSESTRRFYAAQDIEILDVILAGNMARVWYGTEGSIHPASMQLHPGTLRPVDIQLPIPDLAVPGSVAFAVSPNPVAGWNDILGGDTPPDYGKGAPLVGLLSVNGRLFVHGTHRNYDEIADGTVDAPKNVQWNGLSFIPDATADPSTMAATIQEWWSAGPELGLGVTGSFHAVPEGSTVAVTRPTGAALSRFYVAANYCGREWAGFGLLLDISNLASVNPNARMLIPYYEFLGDAWDAGQMSAGPLGVEMPRLYYTCPPTVIGPDCPDEPPGIDGNKLRPILYVQPTSGPNAGKRFIIAGLNLDPIDINTYGTTNERLDGQGRDDGKYDYLAFTDITNMVAVLPGGPPPTMWHFQDLAQLKSHTTFLRLPPDLPAGWHIDNPNNPLLQPGHDWSLVTVDNPNPTEGEPLASLKRIVGSGTPKSIALHPNGRHVYVVASDQGQEAVLENALYLDGGWHVPHLYVVDLDAADFSSQSSVNQYADGAGLTGLPVQKHRFNKVITAKFPDGDGDPLDPGDTGSVLVNSTMCMPTSSPSSSTGKTLVSGATLDQVGPYYPGEHQTDPTARTRLHAVRNTNFATNQDRLYVGTTGKTQSTDSLAQGITVGAVHVLAIGPDGVPTWMRTLALPQGGLNTQKYQVSGLDVFPTDRAWIAGPADRNVLAVTALNTLQANQAPVDRIVLVQDGP